jgi:hypothetical protein
MGKLAPDWVPHLFNSAQKAARVEASNEILRFLQGSEVNQFDGIATGDESWFRYSYPSSTMFARSPADVVPRTRQGTGARKIMITLFVTVRKLIGLNVLPKGHKYNRQYFVNDIFPDLKKANASFHRRK